MKIEEGKFYRTRCGFKVGPVTLRRSPDEGSFPWIGISAGASFTFQEDGRWFPPDTTGFDLVAEWADEFVSEGSKEGVKFDTGKPRLDLIAPEFITGTADILAFGAQKYGERNWEKGMSWSRPFAALLRHMWAWWAGEDHDDETGKSHLWHAACCLMFLIAYEARKKGTDDRPREEAA